MSRVITFSRTFPAYHPRRGEPTYFVEGILTELEFDYTSKSYLVWLAFANPNISYSFLEKFWQSLTPNIKPKKHTIRNHKRPLKVGEYINPHCWAGKPYNKTEEGFWQIKFAPDIEVKTRWEFEYKIIPKQSIWLVKNVEVSVCDSYMQQWVNSEAVKTIAANDGLSLTDFCNWFPKPFTGQIICWSDNVQY